MTPWADCSTVVEYSYNSRGEQTGCAGTLSTALGILNPFRYRGYVYDEETGLYYLQSRYYDPDLCRFLSADVYLSTGQGVIGCNAFAYCGNEPVTCKDTEGTYPDPIIIELYGDLTQDDEDEDNEILRGFWHIAEAATKVEKNDKNEIIVSIDIEKYYNEIYQMSKTYGTRNTAHLLLIGVEYQITNHLNNAQRIPKATERKLARKIERYLSIAHKSEFKRSLSMMVSFGYNHKKD